MSKAADERADVGMAPTYERVRWHQDDPEYPVLIWSEIGADRYETRKVERYPDGHEERAGPGEEGVGTRLGDQPIPPLAEINADPEFDGEIMDAAEFDAAWERSAPAGAAGTTKRGRNP